MEVVDETHFEMRHLPVRLVDPDRPLQLLRGVLNQPMRLRVFSSNEIEHNRRPPAKHNPALVAHIHDVQQPAHADRRPFQRLPWRRLLRLLHQLRHPLRLFLLVMIAQRLPIALHRPLDHVPIHEEVLILFDLRLLYLAGAIDILHGLHRSIGVRLAHLIQPPLVFLHLLHQLPDVGQRRIHRCWLGLRRPRPSQRDNTPAAPATHRNAIAPFSGLLALPGQSGSHRYSWTQPVSKRLRRMPQDRRQLLSHAMLYLTNGPSSP